MEYKLTYFAGRGRAEIIRLIFAAAGVEFEDERLTREEWPTFKPKMPMKSIPVLTIKDKGMICQTGAIARYLAKKYDLFGSSPWEEMLNDEVLECVQDMIAGAIKWVFETDEAKKEELKRSFEETTLATFVDYLHQRLKDGKNGHIVGDKLSVADLAVFNFVEAMKARGMDCFDKHDDVMQLYALVKANDGVSKWLQNRPQE